MANIAPTFFGCGLGAVGVSINVTGAACVGTVTGDYITPIDDILIDGIAVHYDEDGGTGMSAAALTFDVLVGSDATAYKMNIAGIGAVTFAVTADVSEPYFNLWGVSAAAGAFCGGAIKAIRAVAVITGTGAGNDALKVTFCGSRRR